MAIITQGNEIINIGTINDSVYTLKQDADKT